MSQPTQAILDTWRNGNPVVLVSTTDTPRTSGADRWRFAAVRQSVSAPQITAPGRCAWRSYVVGSPEHTFCVSGLTMRERETWRIASLALSILTDPRRWRAVCEAMSADPDTHEWYVAVRCKVCDEWLTHPVSIKRGTGPQCSGYYAALEVKRNERTALVDTFVARMAARGAPVLPLLAALTSCPGTCNPNTPCPDCD